MFKVFPGTLAVALLSTTVFCFEATAQQQGGDTGQTGQTGGTGTGIGTNMEGGLDPDAAFSAIERSDTAGATTRTVGRDENATGAGGAGATGGLGRGGAGGGLGGFGGLGGLGNLFGGGGFGQGGGQATQPPIRTRLRSAVDVDPIAPARVQQNATSRFRDLFNRPAMRDINVTVRDRTAVLNGSVPDESSRRMSELLMRLEPGVSRVDNQINVSP